MIYGIKNNYFKANLTLGLVSAGFFLSYPFHVSFAGGLISSGCCAGMIGGLADWFAVNALFRRPLNIKPGKIIRTEIIARNRERIFNALVEMVQNELLQKKNLKNKMNQYNLSKILVEYFTMQSSLKELEDMILTLIQSIIVEIDHPSFKNLLDKYLEEGLNNIELASLLAKIIKFSLTKQYIEPILDFLFELTTKLVKHSQVTQLLILLIQSAYDLYEGDNAARKLVSSFLPSSIEMTLLVQEKIIHLLSDPDTRQGFKSYLERLSFELETNNSLQEKVEKTKINLFRKLNLHGFIFKDIIETTKTFENKNSKLEFNINIIIHNTLNFFVSNSSIQEDFNNLLKLKLTDWIDNKHDKIGRIVRDNLNNLSNDMLIKIIEAKSGNDLQMIRINGSLFGGLVGIFIYLMTLIIS